MPAPRVVALRVADAGELLTLQRAAYVSEARLYGDAELPPLTQTLAELREELAGTTALGAVQDGRLVGAVRARAVGDVWHVGRLVVAPDQQGRGTGAALLAAIEAEHPPATTSGALFTGHRSAGNLRLYARHGWVEQRREPAGPGLVLVHLVKPLGPPLPVERELQALEEGLWRAATRFDRAHMEAVLAADFTEVGRSGRAWTRDEVLDMPVVALDVELPLPGFAVRRPVPGVAVTTYRSVVAVDGRTQVSHRSSLWVHDGGRWRLAFHQGTPASEPTARPGRLDP